MARATCRCGQALELPPPGMDHVQCPKCGARVRIIRKRAEANSEADPGGSGDGLIRFSCPCGRRLKVSAVDPPAYGKCPDCDRIVPVPSSGRSSSASIESPTDELAQVDLDRLEAWSKSHLARGSGPKGGVESATVGRSEAGLRVCPRCGKPIHLNADTCRACGIPVPKR